MFGHRPQELVTLSCGKVVLMTGLPGEVGHLPATIVEGGLGLL